jgi:hypothetical protein
MPHIGHPDFGANAIKYKGEDELSNEQSSTKGVGPGWSDQSHVTFALSPKDLELDVQGTVLTPPHLIGTLFKWELIEKMLSKHLMSSDKKSTNIMTGENDLSRFQAPERIMCVAKHSDPSDRSAGMRQTFQRRSSFYSTEQ